MSPPKKFNVGDVVGTRTVTGIVGLYKNRSVIYSVECKCGHKSTVRATAFAASTACRWCHYKNRRGREVLMLNGRGFTVREIALALGLTLNQASHRVRTDLPEAERMLRGVLLRGAV